MNFIRESSPSEAIWEWLKAELNSSRFGADLRNAIHDAGYNDSIIVAADIKSPQQNEVRWQILKSYRKWLDINFDSYRWQLVELNRGDVSKLRYIDYSYWNELSDGTRKVERAVSNVVKGKIVFGVTHDRFFSVAKAVEAGQPLPPIIAIADSDKDKGEIIEGHLRATGYLLAGQSPQPLRAIWGRLRNETTR